jgi:drug/metabolite transporter (DMT)-like permease
MPDQADGERRAGSGPFLYLFVTMALFGAAFTSSKVVVGQMPHDVAAALRFGGGALILVVLLRFRSGQATFSWRELCRAGAVGLVGVFAYNFFFFWGLSLAPAIDGSLIVPVLSPVLTTFTLIFAGREAANAVRVMSLLIGVGGAVVFFAGIGNGGAGLTGGRLLGDLFYLLAALCWAAYSIASKKVLGAMEPLRATTYAIGAGAIALLLVSLPSLPRTHWSSVSVSTWANVVFLAAGPTAIAYLFYYRGLRSVSPVTATIAMFAVPVFGTVLSIVFLGESFTSVQLVGALVTVAGALVGIARSPKPRPTATVFHEG